MAIQNSIIIPALATILLLTSQTPQKLDSASTLPGLFLYFPDFKQEIQIDQWQRYEQNPPGPVDRFIRSTGFEEDIRQQADHNHVHDYGDYFHSTILPEVLEFI